MSVGNPLMRGLIGTAIIVTQVTLQGCVGGSPTTQECEMVGDPAARVHCLDQIMYKNVGEGIGIGAITGAVLGGAIGFAATRSFHGAAEGGIAGGMVGGVAGGLAAYVGDLKARSAGDISREAAKNAADLAAFNRKNTALTQALIELISKKATKENIELAKIENMRAKQVIEVHIKTSDMVGKDGDTDNELRVANTNVAMLSKKISEEDRTIRAMPVPENTY